MTSSGDGEWVRACARDAIAPGDLCEIELDDGARVLLVGGDDGEVFACAADCPHQDTPLEEGDVDGATIICPVHFWQWNLRTGEAMGVAELPLPVYGVEVRGDDVFVKLTPADSRSQ
ncbi:MAG: Rieske 2Fe-2S domain-containing protein [Pseudomonadota bacterium]